MALQDIRFFGLVKPRFTDVLIGLGAGLVFILLNTFTGMSIGIPLYGGSILGKYLVVALMAPIAEELLFRAVIPWLLSINNYLLWIGSFVSFSGFHYYTYGASFAAANASFIGAAIFGMMSLSLFFIFKNRSIVMNIVFHGLVNLFILGKYFVIVGGL